MENGSGRKPLYETTPSELVRRAAALIREACVEFKRFSLDQERWYGRTRRALLITEPDGAATDIFREIAEATDIALDVMPIMTQEDLNKVQERLTERRYDLLIPTNLELSPRYIPGLVSFAKEKCPGIRILVASGYGTLEFIQDLMARGIDKFLFVPNQLEELQATILELLPGGDNQR